MKPRESIAGGPLTPPDDGRAAAVLRRWSSDGVVTSRWFRRYATAGAFALIFAFYWIWLGERFMNVDGRLLDVHQNVPMLLCALAAVVTLMAGQFDLSVASATALSAALTIGLASQDGWPLPLVIVVCLMIGGIAGLINGWLVVRVRVNAFIATLGTGGVLLGFSYVYSQGTTVAPDPDGRQLPSWFSGADSIGNFGTAAPAALVWLGIAALIATGLVRLRRARPRRIGERRWDGVVLIALVFTGVLAFVIDLPAWVSATSSAVAILLAVTFALWVLINHTMFGRHVRATGANAEAARLAGAPAGRVTVWAFVLGGTLAAFAGIMFAAQQGAAAPGAGSAFLLPAFAAAFLSTVVFSTGLFTVWGTVLGGIFLIWVSAGLIQGGLHFTWTDVVNGAVLVVAVAIASVGRKR